MSGNGGGEHAEAFGVEAGDPAQRLGDSGATSAEPVGQVSSGATEQPEGQLVPRGAATPHGGSGEATGHAGQNADSGDPPAQLPANPSVPGHGGDGSGGQEREEHYGMPPWANEELTVAAVAAERERVAAERNRVERERADAARAETERLAVVERERAHAERPAAEQERIRQQRIEERQTAHVSAGQRGGEPLANETPPDAGAAGHGEAYVTPAGAMQLPTNEEIRRLRELLQRAEERAAMSPPTAAPAATERLGLRPPPVFSFGDSDALSAAASQARAMHDAPIMQSPGNLAVYNATIAAQQAQWATPLRRSHPRRGVRLMTASAAAII